MIKFIATDLDGTLLNEERRLPEGIFDVVTELDRCGVLFAPASGRQYANLKKMFAPVADKCLFICENGAIVKYQGQTLYLNPIPDEAVERALDEIRSIEHLYPMLCCTENAYIETDARPFYDYAVQSYTNCVRVNRLNDLIGREKICKIAIYDELGSTVNCIKKLPHRLSDLRVILSGNDWCDVSAKGSDKGAAVRFIQKTFDLKREECVAFGDHMNDYEMLSECGKAYVPENAYPPLKKLVPDTVAANSRDGVYRKLKEILNTVREERA